MAREALLEVASRLRMRTFRSDNTPAIPGPGIPDRAFRRPGFPDHGFTAPEMMSGRGLSSSHLRGAAENPAPMYPIHGFGPHENFSGKEPPSSSIGRTGNTFGHEYSKVQL